MCFDLVRGYFAFSKTEIDKICYLENLNSNKKNLMNELKEIKSKCFFNDIKIRQAVIVVSNSSSNFKINEIKQCFEYFEFKIERIFTISDVLGVFYCHDLKQSNLKDELDLVHHTDFNEKGKVVLGDGVIEVMDQSFGESKLNMNGQELIILDDSTKKRYTDINDYKLDTSKSLIRGAQIYLNVISGVIDDILLLERKLHPVEIILDGITIKKIKPVSIPYLSNFVIDLYKKDINKLAIYESINSKKRLLLKLNLNIEFANNYETTKIEVKFDINNRRQVVLKLKKENEEKSFRIN